MATTTPNYGWSVPTSTDLVKDGATAIETLGDAVDATVFANASAAIAKTIVDAKGDLIAATAADTVARLAVGTTGQVLKVNSSTATGLEWGAAGAGNLAFQDFTSSGTWTKPSGCTYAWVLLVGGGGAGGGAAANSSIAGGGGGGGMVKFQVIDVTGIATATVTIGAGGTGGTTFPSADGGDSTFGALLTAKGGKGSLQSTGTVADQNAGAYSSDAGTLGAGGGGGAGGDGRTAQGAYYGSSWSGSGGPGYFEKYGVATGTGNSAGGTMKFYPANANLYVVGGDGGASYLGYGGGGGGGIYTGGGSGFVGKGVNGSGSGSVAAAGGSAAANTGGGGGGAGGDATNRNGGSGGSGFCRVIWVG